MNKKMPVAIGMLLLAGTLFGSFDAAKNVGTYIPAGHWSFGVPQLIFLLAFVYTATVGFRLIQNNTNVANQAKWIFLLQAPVISIQGLFHWSWSIGLHGLIGYSAKFGLMAYFPMIPFYHAGGDFYFLPADTALGVNLFALGLAWIAHRITRQAAQKPIDTLLDNAQPQVDVITDSEQVSSAHNSYGFGALLQKSVIASNLTKLVLGALLIYGAVAGALGTLEYIDGYFSDDAYLKGSIYVLYLLAFVYIGVVGFRLSGRFGNVIKKAKWIFALQAPILNIPHLINWSWSTGVGANIGFDGSDFLMDMALLQEADVNLLYPKDEFGIGLNLAALLFAYLLHLLSHQKLNPKIQSQSICLQRRVESLEADTASVPATQAAYRSLPVDRSFNKKWLAAGAIMLFLIGGGIYFASNNPTSLREAHQMVDGYEILPGGDAVLDPKTDLVWKRCSLGQAWDAEQNTCSGYPASSGEYSFEEAQHVAEEFNRTERAQGQPAWRVPTIRELASIRHCSQGFQGEQSIETGQATMPGACAGEDFLHPTISQKVFPATLEGIYWSSTGGDALLSWAVNFNKGAIYVANAVEPNYVRLVRNHLAEGATPRPASTQPPAQPSTESVEPDNVTEPGAPADTQPQVLSQEQHQPVSNIGVSGQVRGLNPQGDGFLAVRTKPDTSATEVAKLHEGDNVLVLQESNAWVYIELQDKNIRGWSHKKWIQWGVATNNTSASQRFIAQDDTVKDTQTGLVWQRCSVGQTWDGSTCQGQAAGFNFDAALKQANNGWRLPTIRELAGFRACSKGLNYRELVDLLDHGEKVASECADGSVRPTLDSSFKNTLLSQYWAATEYRDNPEYAWFLGLAIGRVDYNYKDGQRFVRLVRVDTGS